MIVFKSNLDDISNISQKDKGPFISHLDRKVILAGNFTKMQTAIPEQAFYCRLDAHQRSTEPTTTEPFYLDFGTNPSSNLQYPEGSFSDSPRDSPADHRISSDKMEQPLDLSPASSPSERTSTPPLYFTNGNILTNALNKLSNVPVESDQDAQNAQHTPYAPGTCKSTRQNFGKSAKSFSDFYL